MDSMEHRINWWWLGISRIFCDLFRYCFSRTMWWRLFIECLLCTYIYVALTVFRHSHHGCCTSFCSVDCVIPYAWFCVHKDVYTSRMSLHSPTRTPTQLAMYRVFQIHYSDVWCWIIRVKQTVPPQLYPTCWDISINFVLLKFGHYILFGQAELYGFFQICSDYNDLSITTGDTVVDCTSMYIGYWTWNKYYYYCSSQVKDLGVIFDRVLSLRQHVSYTSKTCRFHLRNSRIRKYIPQDTSVVLVKSLVMSRLDYSNGLFYGLPKCTVSGLQAVQNSAAHIVTQERLRDHDSMSRALIGLHWLPVDKRIEYKLLLYTYKALHD